MNKIFFTICLTLATFVAANAQNEEMSNATVLELLKEGFTTEEIIGAIEVSSTRTIKYDLDFMRKLKAAGADAALTTYIQKIAKVDNGYEGIYWWNGDKSQKIYRSQFEKEQKGFSLGTLAMAAVAGVAVGSAISGEAPSPGVGAALGAGTVLLASTGKDVEKLCIMGATSKNVVRTTQPVFRFYLPKHDPQSFKKEADSWYYSIMNEVQSPNEFQVVKMKTKKNRRLFIDGASFGIAGFSGSNAKGRVVIDFDINEINNNTFEVSFRQPLEPGEYVFFWKNGLSNEDFKQHVFGFDFCITE